MPLSAGIHEAARRTQILGSSALPVLSNKLDFLKKGLLERLRASTTHGHCF